MTPRNASTDNKLRELKEDNKDIQLPNFKKQLTFDEKTGELIEKIENSLRKKHKQLCATCGLPRGEHNEDGGFIDISGRGNSCLTGFMLKR